MAPSASAPHSSKEPDLRADAITGTSTGDSRTARALYCCPSNSTDPSCRSGLITRRYSLRLPRGELKSKPNIPSMAGRWLGPTPSRKRPGASWAITWTCWATATGCLGYVGMIDVPNRMLSVCAAATARMVSPSSPAPPVVSQAADTPRLSAFLIRARMVPASGPAIATPSLFSTMVSPPFRYQEPSRSAAWSQPAATE